MLRINLLPPYIHDKNKVRNLGILWGGVVIVAAAFLLFVNSNAHSALAAANDRHEQVAGLQKQTQDLNAKVDTEKKMRAEIEAKQTFINNARKYNDAWPETFETIRDVTPSDHNIILKSMAIDPAQRKTVTLDGWGSSEATVVRWWMSLRNNTGPDGLFEHVNFQIPVHDYTAPSAKSTGAGTGFGPMGGFPGGPMSGMGGPMSGMGGFPGGPMSGMGGMGGVKPSITPGVGGSMGGPMSGGMGGGNRQSGGVGPAPLEGKMGLNFVASIVLKKALADGISTPVWPAGAGGGNGAAAGFGAPGGPMGSVPAGMPTPGSGGPAGGGGKAARGKGDDNG